MHKPKSGITVFPALQITKLKCREVKKSARGQQITLPRRVLRDVKDNYIWETQTEMRRVLAGRKKTVSRSEAKEG